MWRSQKGRLVAVAAGSVAVLMVCGCGSAESDSAASPSANLSDPRSWSAVEIPDSQVDAAVASLDDIAESTMQETGIPGMAIAVVHDGEVVYAKGFGVREADDVPPDAANTVDADTVFQVASISKPIGASVVASVVGTGEVSWTDPVSQYLPDFALSDPYVTSNVTIADLYAMRSGLPTEAGDDLEWMGYDRTQVLQRLRYLPLTPFRTEYAYTNFGLTAGAQAVANAVGTPWETLSAQRIYTPLGMDRTTSNYAEFLAMDNRATLHTRQDGAYRPDEPRDPQAQSPAGGVSTSAHDMAKWMIMELGQGNYQGQQVVNAAALQESFQPRMTSSPALLPAQRPGQFGYGINIDTDGTGRMRLSFSGAFSVGAATNFVLLPSENLGISVFTNAAPIGAAEAVSAEFIDRVETGTSTQDWLAVYKTAFGEQPQPPPDPILPTPPGPLATYTGVYDNPYYGPMTITVEDTGLVARIGPAARTIPLRPYDGNVFAAQVPFTNVWLPSVTFTPADEPPSTVIFEQFNTSGLGTFTRSP